MSSLYVALVHYPVRDRAGAVMGSAVTNIDVHDIARSCRTYGVKKYFVISPVTAQREVVERILTHWRDGDGKRRMPSRSHALSICVPSESLTACIRAIEELEQQKPRMVVTEARPEMNVPVVSYAHERAALEQETRPTLLLFGTAYGLHEMVLGSADAVLEPISAHPRHRVQYAHDDGIEMEFNHLSVRAAVAITLDRLRG